MSSAQIRIHEAMHRLTSAEKRAARALLGAYPTLALGPVAEFASSASVSAATVLRFIAQLGYGSYPEFQRTLRRELEERLESPLQRLEARPPEPGRPEQALDVHVARLVDNLRATAARIPGSEFEAVCLRLAEVKGACHLLGGRFTDTIAAYFEAHLRLLRPGVRRLDGRAATRRDQLLDVRPGDVAVVFDVRRYDAELAEFARELRNLRCGVVLITDEWMSPVSRHARYVLPCQTATGGVWDSNAALFALVEAIVARVTELSWDTASHRIARYEQAERQKG